MNRKYNLVFKDSSTCIEYENKSFTNISELKDFLSKFLFDFQIFITIASSVGRDFCFNIEVSSTIGKED